MPERVVYPASGPVIDRQGGRGPVGGGCRLLFAAGGKCTRQPVGEYSRDAKYSHLAIEKPIERQIPFSLKALRVGQQF